VGNEAIKAIGTACQVSSSRPLQAIGAFPKKFLVTHGRSAFTIASWRALKSRARAPTANPLARIRWWGTGHSPAWQNPFLCQPLIFPNSIRNGVSVLLAGVGGGDLGRLGRFGEKSAFDKHGRHGGFSQDNKASTLHPAIKRGKPAQDSLIESCRQNQIDRFQGHGRFRAGSRGPQAAVVRLVARPAAGWRRFPARLHSADGRH
jgi:hypothetical protein